MADAVGTREDPSMRRPTRHLAPLLVSLAAIALAACGPDVPNGPASPITGTLETGGYLYQANYYSPLICAPVGTMVRIDIEHNEHGAATKLNTDGDVGIDGLVWVPIGGGTVTLTTTTDCWVVWIAHADFAGLHGDDLGYTITWPA